MRKRASARIAALVGLGLTVWVAPAPAQSYYKPQPTFQGKVWDVFSSTPKPEVMDSVALPKEPPAKGEAAKGQPPKSEPVVQTVADRAREQERLMKVFLRREAVSDKLRDVGVATNNAALVEEAAYLREKAWQIYVKESGRLLGTAVPLAADGLEGGKAVHSAAALSQATAGGDLGRVRDSNRQTSVLREGER
jgi:hypothetical protein